MPTQVCSLDCAHCTNTATLPATAAKAIMYDKNSQHLALVCTSSPVLGGQRHDWHSTTYSRIRCSNICDVLHPDPPQHCHLCCMTPLQQQGHRETQSS